MSMVKRAYCLSQKNGNGDTFYLKMNAGGKTFSWSRWLGYAKKFATKPEAEAFIDLMVCEETGEPVPPEVRADITIIRAY